MMRFANHIGSAVMFWMSRTAISVAADLDRRLGAYFTVLAAAGTDTDAVVPVALDGKTLRGALRARAAAIAK